MSILGLLWRYAGRRARAMTPSAFIKKWKASNLEELSAAHEHFIDLCRLLDEPTPAEDYWLRSIHA
jgi:hypothetical protein